jgi:uncharacterized integral membrane protein
LSVYGQKEGDSKMMNGMMGGMWIWLIVGVLLIVFLVFAILKIARK